VQLPDWVPRRGIKNWSVQDASHNFDNMHSNRARSCVRVNNVRKVIAFRSHPQPEATTRSPPAILARARMRRALRPPLWDTALLGSEVGNSPRDDLVLRNPSALMDHVAAVLLELAVGFRCRDG
jgi:hypothetical protein